MIGVVEEKAAGMTVRPEDKEFIANFTSTPSSA